MPCTLHSLSPVVTRAAAGLALATSLLAPAAAGIGPVPFIDWSQGPRLQGSAPDDPRLIFGFNPQPEPPRLYQQFLSFGDGGAAQVMNRGDFEPGTAFDLYLAIALAGAALTIPPPDPSELANAGKTLSMAVRGANGAHLYDLLFEFESSSGGVLDGATAVAFNPQPEPPAGFGGDSDFGMSFTFTSFSDVAVTLRVLDARGNAVALQQVATPATSALAIAGLLAGLLAGPLARHAGVRRAKAG